jgi:predicted RND superfamily exporter protein
MLRSTITSTVDFCTRRPWPIIGILVLIAIGSGIYAARNFAITSDIGKLISARSEWHKREVAYEAAFGDRYESILVVVDAPTQELAAQAAAALVAKLAERPQLFTSVQELGGSEFFRRNALLFLPVEQVEQTTAQLGRLAPLIGILAADQSLRGLAQTVSFALGGVQGGMFKLDDVAGTFNSASDVLDEVLAGRPASFSWQKLLKGRSPEPNELRKLIEVRPVLDYAALEPGLAANNAIRQTAADLKLSSDFGARVRLTGPIPISDEEFGTVREGALVNAIGTIAIVLMILWLAMKSARLILAVFVTLFVGLPITAAVGLMMVGAFNLISVAFFVLFVGLGVDFAIQFAVRYRDMRHEVDDVHGALIKAAKDIGPQLTLAAAAVAAGFLSFVPTDYRGVAELGQIAGVGMLIAFVVSITFLPALLAVLNPPGEPEPIGYKAFAPIDSFLERHRIAVIAGTLLVAIGGLPLLYFLKFDFNPMNLRSPKVESIATYLELRNDPNLGANSANVLMPSLAEADAAAEQLRKLPEVASGKTANSLVPADQDRKLEAIRGLAQALGPALRLPPQAGSPQVAPPQAAPPRSGRAQSRGAQPPGDQPVSAQTPPTDAQNVAALKATADALNLAAGTAQGTGADAAKRLASDLAKLADADKAVRDRAEASFVAPLKTDLDQLRDYLRAGPVSLETLPVQLRQAWITADGRARVEVAPTGDANDDEALRRFARAVLAVYPEAVGGPVAIQESGRLIISAFAQAGLWALLSIAVLLWIVLGRFGDVLLTLVPLLLAGVVTLEACVLLRMPLNFANIIALPLLLGVGVAFKIYYIMAWRAGETNLLQSSLTRAVIWSALTTATAFGSLWLSSHPGTSSMGKLLALSLVCTMFAAVLFQPALMGRPRSASAPAADA